MQLQELRQLLAKYEASKHPSYWLIGDTIYPEFKQFLTTLNLKPDHYQLAAAELFELAELVTKHEQMSNFSLKRLLGTSYLTNMIHINFEYYSLELFQLFYPTGLINAHNFEAIDNLDLHAQSELCDLFNGHQIPVLTPSPLLLQTIITLMTKHKMFSLKEKFYFLHHHALLKESVLNWLLEKPIEESNIFSLLKVLVPVMSLDDASIAELKGMTEPFWLSEIIVLLIKLGINIDVSLCQLISKNTAYFYSFTRILTTLIELDIQPTRTQIINFINNETWITCDQIEALKLVKSINYLKESFDFIMQGKNTEKFLALLNHLVRAKIFEESKPHVEGFITQQGIFSDTFFKVTEQLNAADLLAQPLLDNTLKAQIDAVWVLEKINKNHIKITASQWEKLLMLSKSRMRMFTDLMIECSRYQQLNQETFTTIFNTAAQKLPPITLANMVKSSRKQTQANRSKITIDNDKEVFLDHSKQRWKGGFGIVKLGYKTDDLTENEPAYVIKRLKHRADFNEAQREVRYQRLLGQEAVCFLYKSRQFVVSDYHGKALNRYTTHELANIPFHRLLKALTGCFAELNTLHADYRHHGDIKPKNVILDADKAILRLIDFGSAKKRYSTRVTASTAQYADHGFGDEYDHDLYGMFCVMITLLVKIFKFSILLDHFELLSIKCNPSIEEQAMINLALTIGNEKSRNRCTSLDAFNYCQQVLDNLATLNAVRLAEIEANTIQRSQRNLDDILRNKGSRYKA